RNTQIQTVYSTFILPRPLVLIVFLAIGCGTEGTNDAPASDALERTDAKGDGQSFEGIKAGASAGYKSRRGGVLFVDSNPMHILRSNASEAGASLLPSVPHPMAKNTIRTRGRGRIKVE
ncbi:MAG: hypothetical protein ACKOBI_10560, partial [Bacteroidota bacterium]